MNNILRFDLADAIALADVFARKYSGSVLNKFLAMIVPFGSMINKPGYPPRFSCRQNVHLTNTVPVGLNRYELDLPEMRS